MRDWGTNLAWDIVHKKNRSDEADGRIGERQIGKHRGRAIHAFKFHSNTHKRNSPSRYK